MASPWIETWIILHMANWEVLNWFLQLLHPEYSWIRVHGVPNLQDNNNLPNDGSGFIDICDQISGDNERFFTTSKWNFSVPVTYLH